MEISISLEKKFNKNFPGSLIRPLLLQYRAVHIGEGEERALVLPCCGAKYFTAQREKE